MCPWCKHKRLIVRTPRTFVCHRDTYYHNIQNHASDFVLIYQDMR